MNFPKQLARLFFVVSISIIAFASLSFVGSNNSAVAQITQVEKVEAQVYICKSKNAVAYHSYKCHGLKRCKHTIEKVDKSDAEDLKYRACKICYK